MMRPPASTSGSQEAFLMAVVILLQRALCGCNNYHVTQPVFTAGTVRLQQVSFKCGTVDVTDGTVISNCVTWTATPG
jgi:hypothetical protein